MPPKRTRVVLPLSEKKRIIQMKEKNPEMSFAGIAEEYYNLTKTVVGVSSIRQFWNNRDAILNDLPYDPKQPRKDISISEEVLRRIEEAVNAHKSVTESFVIEQAQKIVLEHKLNPALYVFSGEWARKILKGNRDDISIVRRKEKELSPITPEITPPPEIKPKMTNNLPSMSSVPYSNDISDGVQYPAYPQGISRNDLCPSPQDYTVAPYSKQPTADPLSKETSLAIDPLSRKRKSVGLAVFDVNRFLLQVKQKILNNCNNSSSLMEV